jgi:hypothetical protein
MHVTISPNMPENFPTALVLQPPQLIKMSSAVPQSAFTFPAAGQEAAGNPNEDRQTDPKRQDQKRVWYEQVDGRESDDQQNGR